MIKAEGVSFAVGKAVLLKETTVDFEGGKFHVIMGANGAGKSTLLKLLAGDIKPSSGTVLLEGKDLRTFSKKALASKRAVLSQHYHLAFPVTVEELVLMGRYPYFVTHPSAKDKSICTEAMRAMDVTAFRERDYTTLSGGEAQKVQMSRVLSQIGNGEGEERRLLFLDEPVSHLDVKYQHQLLRVAKETGRRNTTVIAVLHDINLAIAFADRLLLMKQGRIVYQLADAAALNAEILHDVFDIKPVLIQTSQMQKPFVAF